jgi:hypothetical protein
MVNGHHPRERTCRARRSCHILIGIRSELVGEMIGTSRGITFDDLTGSLAFALVRAVSVSIYGGSDLIGLR